MRGCPAVTAVAATLLLAAGCTSDTPDQVQPPSDEVSTAEDNEPDTTSPPTDYEVAALWEDFLQAWLEEAEAEEPDPEPFEHLATDPDGLVEALAAQRLDGRTVTTEHELWPEVAVDGDTATIDDCVIATQHPVGQDEAAATVSVRWQAEAVAVDDGWRVETAQPLELFCVPPALNEELLEAYRHYRDAREAAWDPPDPDLPALEETMAGEHLEFIRELLAEHEREGIVVRDPAPTTNAVVWELGIGTATVSDCFEQVPERGAYDLETGERLDDLIPPVRDGQLDAISVELVRTAEGAWKVEQQDGTRDTDCTPGSTRYAVR